MLIYNSANYITTNPNSSPAPQEGLTFNNDEDSVFFGIGSGIGARQIIGLSPLSPCPPNDCRPQTRFSLPVFAGSTVNIIDNDFNTWVLEYPFSGSPPIFDQNVSKWILRKDDGTGTFEQQEVLSQTSLICDFWNLIPAGEQFIYFCLQINWDAVLTAYGEGCYDIVVSSNIGGSVVTQCSEVFKLKSFCCGSIGVPVPPPVDGLCTCGVYNGNVDTSDGWSLLNSGGYIIVEPDNHEILIEPTGGDVNFQTNICTDTVDGQTYAVTVNAQIFDPNYGLKVFLGTGSSIEMDYLTSFPATVNVTSGGITSVVRFKYYWRMGGTPTSEGFALLKSCCIPELIPSGSINPTVSIANWNFQQLGQTFNPLGAYYTIPGWEAYNGLLRFENTDPLGHAGLNVGHSAPIGSTLFGTLRGTTNPILIAGVSYIVTWELGYNNGSVDWSIALGGTFGATHNAPGVYVQTIVCGTDASQNLLLRAAMNSGSSESLPAAIKSISIVRVLDSEPQEPSITQMCYEVANGTTRLQPTMSGKVITLIDKTRFDFNREFTKYTASGNTVLNGLSIEDQIRIPGFFGRAEDTEEKTEIKYQSGLVQNRRQELINSYKMRSKPLPFEVLRRIRLYSTFSDDLLVSDFNENNSDFNIKQISVMIDGEWKPEYKNETRLARIECKFKDRTRNTEARICF